MPYKIVKTFEKGTAKLSIAPSNWERDGILHWPRYNENKLKRVENSCPDNNWRRFNCKVKRSNLISFHEAEKELDKMCKKSETDTDTEQYFNYVTMPNQKETFEQIVQNCITYDNISPGALAKTVGALERQENDVLCQTGEARNFENALIAIQPPAINTDYNATQYKTQPDEARNLENALIAIHPPAINTDSNATQYKTQPDEARNLENALIAIYPPAINTDSNAKQYEAQPEEARNLENALIAIHPPAINTDSYAQQNKTQPDKAKNLGNALIVIQPPNTNTDSCAQQNVTTEVQIDNASLTLMILAKIETLQENYKTLNEKITENIKAQQNDRKFMSESVQSILLGLSNISVQFEHVMNQFNREENNKQKANIQSISSEMDLRNFEKILENPEVEEEWKKKFSIICGKGKGRGVNNAYALVDAMFSRCFLLQCSWAGGSRTSEEKICFKSHTKIINFFFDIIRESDSSYTLLECHKFFKNILKNSRQRNESKQERTSRTKNRPKIKAKRKNSCNEKQPSLPITGTSKPENHSEVSLPAVGTSGAVSQNRSEVSLPVVGTSGPDSENRSDVSLPVAGTSGQENRSVVSLQVVGKSGPENVIRIHAEPLETPV